MAENILTNKKVMWVVGFTPEKIGSYEELMLSMTEESKRRNFRISFVFPKEPRQDVKRILLKAGSNVFILPLKRDIKSIKQLATLIKEEKVNILHSNFALANFCCCFAVLFAKVSVYIWHQHNFMGHNYPLIRRLFMKFLDRVPDKVIVITEAMERNLISAGLKKKKIKLIYNGIRIAKFGLDSKLNSLALRKEFNISSNATVLTSIGDARPEKGQIFLIKAFAKIIKKFPQTLLLLIGSKHGSCHEELKSETKKLGLEDKVFFTEMRSDIPQILNISDIVIVSPTLEVSLYSIMEAMASFKPVIATQIGGIPEVVADGKTGILFPKGDVDTLTKAANYLISNPETRRRMGSLGRRIIEEKFNLNRHVEEFLDLYEELLQLKNLD